MELLVYSLEILACPPFYWLDWYHSIMALYIDTFNHQCVAWLYSKKHIMLYQTSRKLLLSTSLYWLEGYCDIMVLYIDAFNHKCVAGLYIVKIIQHSVVTFPSCIFKYLEPINVVQSYPRYYKETFKTLIIFPTIKILSHFLCTQINAPLFPLYIQGISHGWLWILLIP